MFFFLISRDIGLFFSLVVGKIVAVGTVMDHIYFSSSLCTNISPAVKVFNSLTECSLSCTGLVVLCTRVVEFILSVVHMGEIPLLIHYVFVFLLLLYMFLNLLNKLIRNKPSCVYSGVIFSFLNFIILFFSFLI